MDVKDIIKTRRIEMGYTMKDLAEKVGVTEGTISRWESGEIANMRRDKIMLLANALGLSPAVIMGWEEPPKQDHYIDPEAASLLQEIFDTPELHALFKAARGSKPKNVELVTEMLTRMKETNPDG